MKIKTAFHRGTLLAGFLLPAQGLAQHVFVAPPPLGDDANDGLSHDHSVATPQRASMVARSMKSAAPDSLVVEFASGTYTLNELWRLGPEDSAVDGRTITYRSASADSGDFSGVLISGGVHLADGWSASAHEKGTLYSITMDASWQGLRDLYVGNQRALRARFPNPAEEHFRYLTIRGMPGETQDQLLVSEVVPGLGPDAPSGMEAVAPHAWTMPRQLVDLQASRDSHVVLSGRIGHPHGTPQALKSGDLVYFENSPAFIDTPLEWSLTTPRVASAVTIRLLLTGEKDIGQHVVAPRLERLVVLEGCSGIIFEGLNFAFTNQPLPQEESGRPGTPKAGTTLVPGYDPGQAARDLGSGDSALSGAIEFRKASRCEIRRCRIAHTGGHGLMIDGPQNVVTECEIFDTGSSAVAIGPFGADWPGITEASADCTLSECFIHDYGIVYADAVGVWTARAPRVTIEHNEIARGGYSGISAGWVWGHAYHSPRGELPVYSVGQVMERTRIRANNIHHVMRELPDGGAIYVLGSQAGPTEPAEIAGNWIHDNAHGPEWAGGSGWALCFDEGSDGWLVVSNVVERSNPVIFFNLQNVAGGDPHTPNSCSVIDGATCHAYGHATWHSPFKSDNGKVWPGQRWDAARPNYFDGDPTDPRHATGTQGLPAYVIMRHGHNDSAPESLRRSAGPTNAWVFKHDPLVHSR